MIKNWIARLISILLLVSPGLFTGTEASAQVSFMEFIKSDGINQLFIMPLKFEDKQTKSTFEIDVTLTDTVKANSYVPVNFSIITDKEMKSLKQVFYGPDSSRRIQVKTVMFTEPSGHKKTLTRMSGRLKVADIRQLYNGMCKIKIAGEQTLVLDMPKKSVKKLESINLILDEYIKY